MRVASALVLVFAAVLALAGPSGAATLTPQTRCYKDNSDVVIDGAGFVPLSTINVARDGVALGSVVADANGAFRRKFPTPELPRDVGEQVYDVTASDGVNTVATRYRASKLFANFAPLMGDLATLKVRFTVQGFGLKQQGSSVYLHYVRPSGKLRSTIRLGTARGTCGVIRRTKERRLFPFPDAERGTWILQFDTRKEYERATSRRTTPWVRKPVEIFTKS